MASKILTTTNLAELAKLVPPNQIQQFEVFRRKTFEYRRQAKKYPDKLPTIDWEYYRQNVRADCIKLVDQFQIKYEELNHSFARRHEALDHSKYFTEWKQLTDKVQDEVDKFIEDSVKRIKTYREKIEHLKSLSYENMTMEQFVELREDVAKFIPGQGKPLFWPHRPEEEQAEVGKTDTSIEDENKAGNNQDETISQESKGSEDATKSKDTDNYENKAGDNQNETQSKDTTDKQDTTKSKDTDNNEATKSKDLDNQDEPKSK